MVVWDRNDKVYIIDMKIVNNQKNILYIKKNIIRNIIIYNRKQYLFLPETKESKGRSVLRCWATYVRRRTEKHRAWGLMYILFPL